MVKKRIDKYAGQEKKGVSQQRLDEQRAKEEVAEQQIEALLARYELHLKARIANVHVKGFKADVKRDGKLGQPARLVCHITSYTDTLRSFSVNCGHAGSAPTDNYIEICERPQAPGLPPVFTVKICRSLNESRLELRQGSDYKKILDDLLTTYIRTRVPAWPGF